MNLNSLLWHVYNNIPKLIWKSLLSNFIEFRYEINKVILNPALTPFTSILASVLHIILDVIKTYPVKNVSKSIQHFFQSFIKSARWWSSRQKVIEYPGYTPGHVRNETITAIRIYDHQLNGQTGYASILRGGVGYKNVTIRLYSGGAGRGFNFLVQIFGHWYLTFTKYAK